MYFDSHAHLNFYAFEKDRDKMIKECIQEKIQMINVGSNFFNSKKAVEIADNYQKGVWAAIALHPIHLETGLVKIKKDEEESANNSQAENVFDYEKYKELAKSKKVVAIGETGLDYYWKPKTASKLEEFKRKQKELLEKHINISQELNLPIIFHCRMAHQDLIEFLESKIKKEKKKLRGVIHCFTGTWEQAEKYLEMGFFLGFNGIIFKLDLNKVIKKSPIRKILFETDCPYLSPPGYKERNDPMGIKIIIQKAAKIKEIKPEEMDKQALKNAQELFNI